MSTFPEPQTLTPAAARALVRSIRGRLRPQALRELGRLYGESDGGALARAQIMAEELRLQKLDQYILSLMPVVGSDGRPLGWESFRPAMRGLRRPAEGQVETEVDLPFTPENHECIHGPLTLLPIAGLARKLLRPRERLARVERVTWAAPLRHRARLSLLDTAAARPEGAEERDAALSGRLHTSEGRTFDFVGRALADRPLLLQRDRNGLSTQLVGGARMEIGAGRDSAALPLAESGFESCVRAARGRPALAAAVLFDLVPILILNWKRGRPMMCCGYRDVTLPRSLDEVLTPGARLEVRYRADRSHASPRSGLWIAHYEFRYLPWRDDWSVIVMAEADDLALLLRKVHS